MTLDIKKPNDNVDALCGAPFSKHDTIISNWSNIWFHCFTSSSIDQGTDIGEGISFSWFLNTCIIIVRRYDCIMNMAIIWQGHL